MQLFLHGRYRHDPFMRGLQVLACLFRLDRVRLQQQDARDDLQAVVDSMVHLLQQKILLPQQLVFLVFQGAALGDVFDRHQQACAVVALIEHLSGIQQHRAPADCREIVLDLEFLDRGVVRDNVFKQLAERRNVPLTIA